MKQYTSAKPTTVQKILLVLIITFASLLSLAAVYFHRADYFTVKGEGRPQITRHLSSLGVKFHVSDAAGVDSPDGKNYRWMVRGDEPQYLRLAVSLAENGQYKGPVNLYRPPVYPAFLALLYLITDNRLVGVYFVQAVLFILTLLLVYRIALYITGNYNVALMTVGLSSLWFPFYQFIPRLLTENVMSFLVAASLWLVLLAADNPTYKRCIAAGVVIGLTTLTRATMAPFVLLAPLLVYLRLGKGTRRLASAGLILILALVTILPWTYRNYRATGYFVPVSTGGGLVFFLGNSPEVGTTKNLNQEDLARRFGVKGGHSGDRAEVERDKALARIGFMRIRENPKRAAGLFIQKFSGCWLGWLGRDPRMVSQVLNKSIPHIGNFGIPKRSFVKAPLFVAALMGWFLLPPLGRIRGRPVIWFLIMWTGVFVATLADERYTLPAQFYEMMLASVTGWYILSRVFGRSKSPAEQ